MDRVFSGGLIKVVYVVMVDFFLGDVMDISLDVFDVGNCFVREDVFLVFLDR